MIKTLEKLLFWRNKPKIEEKEEEEIKAPSTTELLLEKMIEAIEKMGDQGKTAFGFIGAKIGSIELRLNRIDELQERQIGIANSMSEIMEKMEKAIEIFEDKTLTREDIREVYRQEIHILREEFHKIFTPLKEQTLTEEEQSYKSIPRMNIDRSKVLAYIKKHNTITTTEIAEVFNLTQTAASNKLRRMADIKLIAKIKKGLWKILQSENTENENRDNENENENENSLMKSND